MYWVNKYFSAPAVHRRALFEVFVVSLFSIAPFVVVYFVHAARADDEVTRNTLTDLFGRGQMFLLAYGIYGTIFWLAFLKGDRPRHDARVILGLLATLCIFPVIGFIGVDPTFSTIVNDRVVHIGYWLYGGLSLINYLLLFYMEIDPPQPSETFERETKSMRDQYEAFDNE